MEWIIEKDNVPVLEIRVKMTDTVLHIKRIIQENMGIPVWKQVLLFGNILSDELTVMQCQHQHGIEDRSYITLFENAKIKINEKIPMLMDGHATVLDLKDIIKEIGVLEPSNKPMILLHRNKAVDDKRRLERFHNGDLIACYDTSAIKKRKHRVLVKTSTTMNLEGGFNPIQDIPDIMADTVEKRAKLREVIDILPDPQLRKGVKTVVVEHHGDEHHVPPGSDILEQICFDEETADFDHAHHVPPGSDILEQICFDVETQSQPPLEVGPPLNLPQITIPQPQLQSQLTPLQRLTQMVHGGGESFGSKWM